MKDSHHELKWIGSEDLCLDIVKVRDCGNISLGCYGGNIEAGADKNEDAVLIMSDSEQKWKFTMLLDAHTTNESAQLVINTIEEEKPAILSILNLSMEEMFNELQTFFLNLFNSDQFKEKCKWVRGETACLICVQREKFLWWLSIGDNLVFLFHPELAELGQFALNQRQFYQWIGQVNSFELPIPCYSFGIRELREGLNYIYLITDGVLECGHRPFEEYNYLYEVLTSNQQNEQADIKENISNLLNQVHMEKGRDSATVIGWSCFNDQTSCRPSR